ncbi:tRNA dihydrouridine(20/20a) synthase DusA [Pyruvatibacter sp.]|uniref:tRNA dihydrouridine(20/20a) synthase DusA n=1 Tax=Pyruvatibacter sp. TaxID=1981328 RepID=UPI0032EB6CC7
MIPPLPNSASPHRFSVAPMMEWTDRHCRAFHRCMTTHARLYTEMVTAAAVINGDRKRLLGFSPVEHPVALQIGGSDPAELAQAAKIGADFGYDEINLNVGCPSDRVQSGSFGACLMREPDLVARGVAAMKAQVDVPVTVKCRIGVDNQVPADILPRFAQMMRNAGADALIVHARMAWLDGLSPKQNRDVPPLDYPLVHALKKQHPDWTISINGGVQSIDQALAHLTHMDGVMMGRTAYNEPFVLADVDARVFGAPPAYRTPHQVLDAFMPYMERELANGTRLNSMARHVVGLFHGVPGARAFRRHLSENMHRDGADLEVIREAMQRVAPSGNDMKERAPAPAAV